LTFSFTESSEDKFFFFFSSRVLTLMFASQALYHVSHGLKTFCFSYFLDRVLYFFLRASLRPWSVYFSVFFIAGIIDVYHYTWVFLWGLLTFWMGLPQTTIFLLLHLKYLRL
jgi:hypothetical protein